MNDSEFWETTFQGMRQELCAGKVLSPKGEADRVWNDATDRAIRILQRYKVKDGLFQMQHQAQDKATS